MIYIQTLVEIINTKEYKTETFCKYHIENVIITLNETKTTDATTLMILKNIVLKLCVNLEDKVYFETIVDSIDYLKIKYITHDDKNFML